MEIFRLNALFHHPSLLYKSPKDLIGKDAYQLHDELCRVTGKKHDPCVIDVFLAVVDFMEGGDPVPWWKYTAERKKHISRNHKE